MKTVVQNVEASQSDDVFAWIVIASIVTAASLIFYGSFVWQAAYAVG